MATKKNQQPAPPDPIPTPPPETAPELRAQFGHIAWLLISRETSADKTTREELWCWPVKGHGVILRFRSFIGAEFEENFLTFGAVAITEQVDDAGVVIERWLSKDSAPGAIQRTKHANPNRPKENA